MDLLKWGWKNVLEVWKKKNIKARMANKFLGFKETQSGFIEKDNQKITFINLEITKKDWLNRSKILHSKFPELFNEY